MPPIAHQIPSAFPCLNALDLSRRRNDTIHLPRCINSIPKPLKNTHTHTHTYCHIETDTTKQPCLGHVYCQVHQAVGVSPLVVLGASAGTQPKPCYRTCHGTLLSLPWWVCDYTATTNSISAGANPQALRSRHTRTQASRTCHSMRCRPSCPQFFKGWREK